ncbi:hypothetical protein [Allorhizocola rhizosphaerae]|uniref:hypothetical protein n=1 Tax=Allorhizocola rhizosphaerae TaxID=1872709 RepID=UPI000E3C960F|nr:hypothetical protein [Allorhizocola rhizosphaerae]
MNARLSIAAVAATALVSIGFLLSGAHAVTPFSDDFEDGNTSGWSQSGGQWSVVAESWLTPTVRLFAGSSGWISYTVEARVKPTALTGVGSFAGIAARAALGSNSAIASGRRGVLTDQATAQFDDAKVTDTADPGPTTLTAPPDTAPAGPTSTAGSTPHGGAGRD